MKKNKEVEQLKKENEELKELIAFRNTGRASGKLVAEKVLRFNDLETELEQLQIEVKQLKSEQNKVAIEKLEELSDIINENITDLVESGKSKYGWLDFSDTTNKLDTMIAELKGENDEESYKKRL